MGAIDSDDDSSPIPDTPTLHPFASPTHSAHAHAHTDPPSPLYHPSPTHLAPIAPSHHFTRRSSSPPSSAISTLALPQAISLTPHKPLVVPPQKSRTAWISITPMIPLHSQHAESVVETLPRSIRNLRSMGDSTAKPPLAPNSLVGETTVKAGSMDHHAREYQAIINGLKAFNSTTSDTETVKPGAVDGGGEAVEGVRRVDEIEVEWCWFCHDEYPRGEMVLKLLEKDGQQWVCEGCIKQNHEGSGGSRRRAWADMGKAEGEGEVGRAEISMVRGELSAL